MARDRQDGMRATVRCHRSDGEVPDSGGNGSPRVEEDAQ
jgi:hypothetical protein